MAQSNHRSTDEAAVQTFQHGKREQRVLPLSDLIDPPEHLIAREIGDVSGLTADMEKRGQLQSLLVRPSRKHEGKFEVLAGRRRRAALKKAGKGEAAAVVAHDLDDDEKALAAVWAENFEDNRSNLSPLQQARMFQTAVKQAKAAKRKDPTKHVASLFRVSTETVRRGLMLLKAPVSIQKRLAEGKISKDIVVAYQQTAPEVQTKLRSAVERGEIGSAKELKRHATEIASKKKIKQPKDKRKVVAPRRVWLSPSEASDLFDAVLWEYAVYAGTVKDAEVGKANPKYAEVRKQQLAVFFALMGKTEAVESDSKAFRRALREEVERITSERSKRKAA